MMKKAIYLSGGGARGAYQVGVLKGIGNILNTKKLPVQVLNSVSAGSINAAFLAMYADDFPSAITNLVELWSSLSPDKIFYASNFSLLRSIFRNFSSLVLRYKIKKGGYLLDTAPLKKILDVNLNFKKINENVNNGFLTDFEVLTTCYNIPETVSFLKSMCPKIDWEKDRHKVTRVDINCRHIIASAAIPLFFPAVPINELDYGDGGLRLMSPLRTSIKLGAEKILVIGTRKALSPEQSVSPVKNRGITFAKILGTMLSSLFLDNLDRDIELLKKINNYLDILPPQNQKETDWKKVEVLRISPSEDLGKLATGSLHELPLFLRYLLTGFGSKEQSGELVSFLLFDSMYCKKLIDIGYADVMSQKDKIEEFFSA